MKYSIPLRKNTIRTFITVWVLMCCCAVAGKSQVILVENGKALGVIILPEKTELERQTEKTFQVLLAE